MASPDQKLSFLLTGGIDNRQFSEFVAPIVQQGSSPNLVDSRNTRLSVIPGTCVRSPDVSVLANVGGPCYGMVPSACGKATVLFNRPERGANRTVTGSVGPTNQLTSYTTGTAQSSYLPIDISNAGAVPGAVAAKEPCVAHNGAEVWYAYVSQYNDVWTIVVSVSNTDGAVLAPPRALVVQALSTWVPWIGLTSHGANGVILWAHNAAGAVQVRKLTRSSGIVGAGSASTVYTPGASDAPFDVVSAGDAYGVLVGPGLVAGDVNVVRVNASTLAVTTATVALGAPEHVACNCITLSGIEYVSVASADSTDTQVTLYRVSDMVQIWAAKTIPYHGQVTLSWLVTGGVPYIVCAVSRSQTGIVNSFSTGGTFDTTFWTTKVDGSASITSSSLTGLPWQKLHTHASYWFPVSGEIYPIFYTYRIYTTLGDFGYGTGPNDLDDPCVTAYMMGSLTQITPVARFGVLRGSLAPARAPSSKLASKGSSRSGERIVSTYLKDGPGKSPISMGGYQSRFVTLDFTAKQPAIAHDKDGVALIAAALPVQWDGQSVVEMGGPIHAPRLDVNPSSGTGTALPIGAYSFVAVQQWVDAAGLLHRSRPSNVVTLSLDGTQAPEIVTTLPDSFRDGNYQPLMDVLVYITAADGTSYHATVCEAATVTSIVHKYDDVNEPDTSKAQIYSLGTAGEELTPQPPPPLKDITIIGSRAWGIDSEVSTRLVYSKLRISGVGFEWHPALEINFPAGAGALLAVREINGIPIVLTERAIYQIAGEGPDNTGAGGTFGSPVKISDRGCSNPASVITTPAGIMWQDGEDMVLFSSIGLKVFTNIDVEGSVAGAVVLRNQDEVVFIIADSADRLVYNYVLDRWTIWDDGTFPLLTSQAALLPWSQTEAYFYSLSNTTVYKLDSTTVGTAPSMSWETDWILLCGDFQDHVIVRNVLFNGQVVSPHSLTIDVFVDYETTPSTTIVWSDAEIATLAVGGRYTVKLELCRQNCRAVKFRVSDTAVDGDTGMSGVAPRSMTIIYAQQSLTFEDAILNGAYKG